MPYVYKVDEEGNGYYDYEEDDVVDNKGNIVEGTDDIGFETSDPNKLYGIEAGYAFDPEAPGFQKYVDADKNEVVVAPDGSYFLNGKKIWSPPAPGKAPTASDWSSLITKLGNFATSPKGAAALAATAFSLGGANAPKTGGWKGSIPKLTAVREQVEMPAYEPYSGKAVMGGKFFTDPQYVGKTDTAGITAAQDAAKAEAARLKGINPTAPAAAVGTKFADNTLTKKQDMSGLRDIYLMPGMGIQSSSGAPPVKTFGSLKELADASGIKPAEEVVTRNTLPSFGAALPPGYKWGPLDEVIPDSIDTPEQYQEWRKSQGVDVQSTPPPPIASNQPAPIGIEQSMPDASKLYQKPDTAGPVQSDTELFFEQPGRFTGGMPIDLEEAMLNRPITAAQGGIMNLAKGRYLAGPTDGMADKIPSSIDGKQPAKLSHGEFVIPADVVSHLGNGNSDAGANQLYKMMDRVRKARTGTTKQGKKINPDRFTPGGIAGYASGGAVAFQAGGGTDTALSRAATANPNLGATQETNLAPWVGDYVGDMLGKSQALAGTGYQAFQGPLSAGTSPLQQQAFTSAGQINPQATFDTAAAQQYMNPFIQTALQPQLDEMRRQAEISRMQTAGRLSKAGAFGGGRQAIMESELLRNLGQQQALTTGKAYETAFDKAMGQYNRSREQQLQDVGALAGLGAQERQIEQQGIEQLRGEFEKQRQFPYEQLKFQQSMLTGLPVGSTTVTPNRSLMSDLNLTARQVGMLTDFLNEKVFNQP
jgi:hypothetical protein